MLLEGETVMPRVAIGSGSSMGRPPMHLGGRGGKETRGEMPRPGSEIGIGKTASKRPKRRAAG